MASGYADGAVNQLVDMGFPLERVKLALSANNNDLNEAMEWLLCHAGEEDVRMDDGSASEAVREDGGRDPGDVLPTRSERTGDGAAASSPNAAVDDDVEPIDKDPGADELVAKTLKCDECGKLFATADEANFHAVKTKHSQFSESTEEKKPLTEEEKKEQMEKLQERLKQRRLEREQKEKEEALNREKNRIKVGKEITEVRRKQEEVEIKKIADERKREKMEEKQARQRVLDQIAKDKEARLQKQKIAAGEAPSTPVAKPPPTSVPVAAVSDKKQYDKTRLQLRLPSGRVLTETFGAKEPLASVRLYVANQSDDSPNPASITLMTSFPKKVFGIDDWEMPLDALDLVPSAVLFVRYN